MRKIKDVKEIIIQELKNVNLILEKNEDNLWFEGRRDTLNWIMQLIDSAEDTEDKTDDAEKTFRYVPPFRECVVVVMENTSDGKTVEHTGLYDLGLMHPMIGDRVIMNGEKMTIIGYKILHESHYLLDEVSDNLENDTHKDINQTSRITQKDIIMSINRQKNPF